MAISNIARHFHQICRPFNSQKYQWLTPKFIEPQEKTLSCRPPCSPFSPVKRRKPRYKPPSSLDRTGRKPLHSDLPFDFQYSYTETPRANPMGFREPRFSPFGPGRIDREWTGWCAPAASIAVTSVDGDQQQERTVTGRWRSREVSGRWRSREEILGEALSRKEIQVLVDENRRGCTKRQVNIGRDGLTHNMLNDIHNNWRYYPAVRIKCLGVPTVDMKNVCFQLEDKTGGKIIYHNHNIIILYRGRNYQPKYKPVIPLMLWKPHVPVYPRLIKTTIEGLTIAETKAMRKRGLKIPALTKLSEWFHFFLCAVDFVFISWSLTSAHDFSFRNSHFLAEKIGVYCNLVRNVQEAFMENELVRIDCKGLSKSDIRKIGAKLRDLVPCVLVTFEKEQIVIWRGKSSSFGKASLGLQGSNIVPLDRTKSLMLVKKCPLVPLESLSNVILPQRL